eukprot:gnl/TRDRNA2_/TRDRNA2_190442_c0_seq1.p1 gnl/TRDRNA2_/TRDRNA2_190442_c0~~gnl/TRDRNA2_/TRDRNA2_190442_c0_seq1.p1  ORF type:complete len:339 (+),score=51.50 gnl/TRDRNA2_/TRDRNA2_190442_c0_seq1:67-1083(+)
MLYKHASLVEQLLQEEVDRCHLIHHTACTESLRLLALVIGLGLAVCLGVYRRGWSGQHLVAHEPALLQAWEFMLLSRAWQLVHPAKLSLPGHPADSELFRQTAADEAIVTTAGAAAVPATSASISDSAARRLAVIRLEDHFATLGIEKEATMEQIKNAYKREVLKWHPDKVDGAYKDPLLHAHAQAKYDKVQRAYEVLSDHRKKLDHEKLLQEKARIEQEKAKIRVTETTHGLGFREYSAKKGVPRSWRHELQERVEEVDTLPPGFMEISPCLFIPPKKIPNEMNHTTTIRPSIIETVIMKKSKRQFAESDQTAASGREAAAEVIMRQSKRRTTESNR